MSETVVKGGVVVLLGAPGSGKSTLGRAIAATRPSEVTFVSVGDALREQGSLNLLQRHVIDENEIRRCARGVLDNACEVFAQSLLSLSLSGLSLQGENSRGGRNSSSPPSTSKYAIYPSAYVR